MTKRIYDFDEYGPGMGFPSMKQSMCAEPYEGMDRIVAYLRGGKKTMCAGRQERDFFTGEVIAHECCGMTDGIYSWTGSLPYYVEKYNLRLDPEFEQHALSVMADREQLAEKEWTDAKAWAIEEGARLKARLSAEGRLGRGLDANSEDFAYIDKELSRRRKEIQQKYFGFER